MAAVPHRGSRRQHTAAWATTNLETENILVVDDEEAIREEVRRRWSAGIHLPPKQWAGCAGAGAQEHAGPGVERHDHAGNGWDQVAGVAEESRSRVLVSW